MVLRMSIYLGKVLLQVAGAGIAALTVVAAAIYAVFMVVWMHAPLLQVVAVSLVLAIPFFLLSWGAFRLARRLHVSRTTSRRERP